MCGFFGAVLFDKNKGKESDLSQSLRLLSHRGPDAVGTVKLGQVFMGHCRLAVFDLSDRGTQPYTKWGKTIIYNGAVYNFPELRKALQKQNYCFDTNTDTEVILAMYDCYGAACVDQFNGQWALAIYDHNTRILFCSRDRFGIKPFYYWQTPEAFYFSSEIKAFTTLPEWKAQINPIRVLEFLSYKMHDHTNETFFKDVKKLGQGCNLIFHVSEGKYSISSYYSVDNIQVKRWTKEDAIVRFNTLFEDSISLRLRADVKVGSALSGGLDSSSIVSRIVRNRDTKMNTFSVVYDEANISEHPYLESLLQIGQLDAQIISPSHQDFEKMIDDVIWHQESPFNGLGVFAQFVLFGEARKQGVKVMLDGQGADEILAGYEKFYLPILHRLMRTNPVKAWRLYREINSRHTVSPGENWKLWWKYIQKRKKPDQKWIRIHIDGKKAFHRPREASILQMSKNLISGLGLPALLRYEDKNAMAHGIESRVPFLDHRLVEFCLSLPDHLKINNGVRKWILREASHDFLPKSILSRYKKLGFATPEKRWWVENQSYYIKTIQKLTPLLDPIVDMKLAPLIKDPDLRWRLFILGKWLEKFNLVTG